MNNLDLFLTLKIYNIGIHNFFLIITHIGDFIFYCLVLIGIFFYNRKESFRIGLIVFSSYLIQYLLKIIFRQPRAFEISSELIKKTYASGFGFPSGHALVAASFWSYLIFRKKDKKMIIAGIFAIAFIGISRINLGVHTFFQVFWGWIFGILIGYLFDRLFRKKIFKKLKF